MRNPQLVKQLVETAVSPLMDSYQREREFEEKERTEVDVHRVRSLLRRAYQEGLRDGFVQGCQAAAEEADTKTEGAS